MRWIGRPWRKEQVSWDNWNRIGIGIGVKAHGSDREGALCPHIPVLDNVARVSRINGTCPHEDSNQGKSHGDLALELT